MSDTPAAPSRSGQVARRIVTGLVLGAVVIAASTVLPTVVILGLILVASLSGQWEFYTLLRVAGRPSMRRAGCVVGTALLSAVGVAGLASGAPPDQAPALAAAALILGVGALALRDGRDPLAAFAYTLFGVLYVPFLLGFVVRVLLTWEAAGPWAVPGYTGRLLAFYLVLVVKMSDIGAYAVGMLFGRHKMFPRVSPGKSWEGLAGGMAAGLAASLVFHACLPTSADFAGAAAFGAVRRGRWDAVALGLLLPAVGVAGDLIESLIKRAVGAKDSGRVLPGMGGVLDVVDSVLFAAPVLYLYVSWAMGCSR
jgi:phosphatidate cytidylyltransferase